MRIQRGVLECELLRAAAYTVHRAELASAQYTALLLWDVGVVCDAAVEEDIGGWQKARGGLGLIVSG